MEIIDYFLFKKGEKQQLLEIIKTAKEEELENSQVWSRIDAKFQCGILTSKKLYERFNK